jgi:hypothetical protein
MTTEEIATFRDRSRFGSGPWDAEPDRVFWRDPATGFPCLALRNRMGAWCGYVAVPPGHSAYGKDYDEVPVEVHGGLTYADFCQEDDREHGVCHTPQPGEPDRVW